jgi:hypothetical protein
MAQRDIMRGSYALRGQFWVAQMLKDVFRDPVVKRLSHRVASPCARVSDACDGRAQQQHRRIPYTRSGVSQLYPAGTLAQPCHMPLKQRVHGAVQQPGPGPANRVRLNLELSEGDLERSDRSLRARLREYAWPGQVGDVQAAVSAVFGLAVGEKCVPASLLIAEADGLRSVRLHLSQ